MTDRKEITQDKATGEYIVWDETYANEVGRRSTLDDACDLLEDYSEWLNRAARD